MSPSANGHASSRSRQKWGPMKWWCTWFGARFSASPHIPSPTRSPARRQVPLGLHPPHAVAGTALGYPWLPLAKDLVDLHGRRSAAGTRARVSGCGCQKQAATPGVASPCKRGTGVDQPPNLVA